MPKKKKKNKKINFKNIIITVLIIGILLFGLYFWRYTQTHDVKVIVDEIYSVEDCRDMYFYIEYYGGTTVNNFAQGDFCEEYILNNGLYYSDEVCERYFNSLDSSSVMWQSCYGSWYKSTLPDGMIA